MNWRIAGRVLVCCVLLVASGCVAQRYDSSPGVVVTSVCDARFREWQAHTQAAGTFDGQDWLPPGFPYLRVDRFLASYDFSALSPRQKQEWLQRARHKAIEAWTMEAQGRGSAVQRQIDGLRACGELAAEQLLARPDLWPRLEDAKAVPDSYSTAARVFGLYPVVAPVVRWRASVTMGALRDTFANYQPASPWHFYRPPAGGPVVAVAELLESARQRSALGIPDLNAVEQQLLFRHFAPSLVVEARGRNDLPGRPGRGLDGELRMLSEPVVYTLLTYTRMNGRVLPQLVYSVWFPARPVEGRVDIYAGALDGFVWRVTLGPDGQPLLYDHMHACGCYHQWLLVEGQLQLKPNTDTGEPLWIMGSVTQGRGPPTLYLSAGEHQLVDLGFDGFRTAGESYRLQPYQSLRGRSYAGGRLFDARGLVTGSERAERWLLWPTGVPSAGAMRQWGHHATAFVGRRHFDDPFLLERFFVLPDQN